MLQLTVNENKTFEITQDDGTMQVNGSQVNADISLQPNGLVSILNNNKSYTAVIENTDTKNKEVTVKIDGKSYTVAIKESIDLLLSNMGLDLKAMKKAEPIKAPMPGLVLKILVTPGQQINKGDGLVILEAMKMENILKATGPATVKSVRISERTAVEKGTILIELE
jgi:biotin carboxyl carrier protein